MLQEENFRAISLRQIHLQADVLAQPLGVSVLLAVDHQEYRAALFVIFVVHKVTLRIERNSALDFYIIAISRVNFRLLYSSKKFNECGNVYDVILFIL